MINYRSLLGLTKSFLPRVAKIVDFIFSSSWSETIFDKSIVHFFGLDLESDKASPKFSKLNKFGLTFSSVCSLACEANFLILLRWWCSLCFNWHVASVFWFRVCFDSFNNNCFFNPLWVLSSYRRAVRLILIVSRIKESVNFSYCF